MISLSNSYFGKLNGFHIADVCFARRLGSAYSSLFECIPNGYTIEDNISVAILSPQLCDGIKQCASGEDETHPSCRPRKGMFFTSNLKVELTR